MKSVKWWMGLWAVLSMVAGFSVPVALGATETVDGVTWRYTVFNGGAEVREANPANGHLSIPDTLGGYPVTTIWADAFSISPANPTSVTIPNSVTYIYASAFDCCSDLESISVSTNNSAYASKGGVLFSKDGTCLVRCPPKCKSGTYSIPDSVTIIGYYAFAYCNGLTNVIIPDSVTNIEDSAFSGCDALTNMTIPDSVTSIGKWAFEFCYGLENVMIGSSVASIGSKVFPCNLTNICVSTNNSTYTSIDGVLFTKDGKTLLRFPGKKADVYSIPNGVTSIGASAFYECYKLTSVTIPDSVTNIEDSAFSGCDGLTSVTLSDSVTSIGRSAFSGCDKLTIMMIPDRVTNIGAWAFCNCEKLAIVTIPDSVTNIGYEAFASDNLRTLYVPASWEGSSMLDKAGVPKGCTVLYGAAVLLELSESSQSVTPFGSTGLSLSVVANVPWTAQPSAPWLTVDPTSGSGNGTITYNVEANTVTNSRTGTISVTGGGVTRTFSVTQKGMVEIVDGIAWHYTVSDGTAYVGSGQFLGTTAVPTNTSGAIDIPSTLGGHPVTGIAYYAFLECSGLTSLSIPDSVTNIVDSAFFECSGLTNMTIPDSVTCIGAYVFYLCRGLTSVTIPDSITSIGASAFHKCSSLESVTIPDSVTSIGMYAFEGCSGLTSLRIPGNVKSLGVGVFDDCSGLKTLYVPASWKGTSMLAKAGVPSGCEVVYEEEPATTTTPVPVAHSWLEENASDILAAHGGDYEAAALADAANKLPVWQCYVAGLSTTDKGAKFKVKAISVVAGKPVLEWDPDLDGDRAYKLLGKRTLSDEAWEEVPDGADAEGWRFFRVRVTLP